MVLSAEELLQLLWREILNIRQARLLRVRVAGLCHREYHQQKKRCDS
jgi:hypothetical protein